MAIGVETSGRLTIGQTVPMRDQKPNLRACIFVDGAPIVGEIVNTILAPDAKLSKADSSYPTR
jgi:hypothetical protein